VGDVNCVYGTQHTHARFACPRVRTRARLDRACARLRLPSDRVLAHARALQARACARLATSRAIIYLRARDIRVVVVTSRGVDTDCVMVQSVTHRTTQPEIAHMMTIKKTFEKTTAGRDLIRAIEERAELIGHGRSYVTYYLNSLIRSYIEHSSHRSLDEYIAAYVAMIRENNRELQKRAA
jgi:hypothetical protein